MNERAKVFAPLILGLLLIAGPGVTSASAQYRQIDLTIFGMD